MHSASSCKMCSRLLRLEVEQANVDAASVEHEGVPIAATSGAIGLGCIGWVLSHVRYDTGWWGASLLWKTCPYCECDVGLMARNANGQPCFLSHATGGISSYIVSIPNEDRLNENSIGDILYDHCPVLNAQVRKDEDANVEANK